MKQNKNLLKVRLIFLSIMNIIFGNKSKKIQTTTRAVYLNNEEKNSEFQYCSNRVKTTKYHVVNFLPKCLLLQFMRITNFYFLAAAIIQSIDVLSPLAPFSAIAPLAFVLAVSLFREAVDDIVNIKINLISIV